LVRNPDTPFSASLIVTIDNPSITATDQDVLVQTFRSAFDSVTLGNANICHPYFPQVTSVNLQNQDVETQIILQIQGLCQGCQSDVHFLQESPTPVVLFEPTGTCTCPTAVTTRFATTGELSASWNKELQLLTSTTSVSNISRVLPFPDTENMGDMYPCTDVVTRFARNITLEVEYLCANNQGGGVDLLGTDTKGLIANAFRSAYNSLRDDVCDPFNLHVLSASVVREGALRENGSILPLQLQVLVACNGCDGDLTDLYGFPGDDAPINLTSSVSASRGRTLGLSPTVMTDREARPGGRYTQEQTMCFCKNATQPLGSPLEVDVMDALDPLLQAIDIACIGNSSECAFGRAFDANALFELQVGPSLTPQMAADILQTAYTTVLTRLISGGNNSQCTCDLNSIARMPCTS
jgi:hypothetical protein